MGIHVRTAYVFCTNIDCLDWPTCIYYDTLPDLQDDLYDMMHYQCDKN